MSAATVARKPIAYVAGAAAALVVALILIATSSHPSATTVSGTYDLDAGYATAGYCVGAGEYSGIYDGAPVWVFDEPGHPLAHSVLAFDGESGAACRFTFSVSSADAPFWVQVAAQEKVRVTDGVMALRSGAPRQP